ncbi:MAG: ABC transporter permease [Bacteroidota bacterium]
MEKLLLIIKREYLTRVTRRSFILATLITPLAFAIFFVVVGFIFSYESDDVSKIAVIENGGILGTDRIIEDEKNLLFEIKDWTLEQAREKASDEGFQAVILIPALEDILDKRHTVFYYSDKTLSLERQLLLEGKMKNLLREYKIEQLQIDRSQLAALETNINLEPEPLEKTDVDASQLTGIIASAIGGIMGFIMYLAIFIYGMMIMRSVMEEKTNRIVEVMVSSVKPFQLMLGKIIGVGAVGLTQLVVWAIMIPSIIFAVGLVFGFNSQVPDMPNAGEVDIESTQNMIANAYDEIFSLNWLLILPLFAFYFLGGYFLYSSLFAAVGSAMGDDLGEGQTLTIPITIPVVLAIYIMLKAIEDPNSSLAVWSSIFPLFSPIVMPARLAFEPPLWEILLSVVVLAASSVFFVWLSGRIYRVGILLYGKKSGFKELIKWIFSKG